MVLEFEVIADDFIDAEVLCDRPDCEIERACNENVAIAEVSRRVDQGLRVGENRRLENHLEKIVCQSNQPVAMHPAVGAERETIEALPRVEIQSEIDRHTDKNFR